MKALKAHTPGHKLLLATGCFEVNQSLGLIRGSASPSWIAAGPDSITLKGSPSVPVGSSAVSQSRQHPPASGARRAVGPDLHHRPDERREVRRCQT